jgi:hypothetical protein
MRALWSKSEHFAGAESASYPLIKHQARQFVVTPMIRRSQMQDHFSKSRNCADYLVCGPSSCVFCHF